MFTYNNMATVNERNYLITRSKTKGGYKEQSIKKPVKDFWTIQSFQGKSGIVQMGVIYFPEYMIGKKIRFKIEFVQENEIKK